MVNRPYRVLALSRMRYVDPDDAEVLRLLAEGESARSVAERLGLRIARVQHVRAKAQAEAERQRRREAARSEIREADDIDRLWPVRGAPPGSGDGNRVRLD